MCTTWLVARSVLAHRHSINPQSLAGRRFPAATAPGGRVRESERCVDDGQLSAVAAGRLQRVRQTGWGTAATAGRSSPRWSPQPAALACGSRSTKAARQPAASAATDRWMASVVLPVPPLCASSVNVYRSTPLDP